MAQSICALPHVAFLRVKCTGTQKIIRCLATATGSSKVNKRFWSIVSAAKDGKSFIPLQLPAALVTASRLPLQKRQDERLSTYLQTARIILEEQGTPVRTLRVSGAVAVIVNSRRLDTQEGDALAQVVVSMIAAEVPQLPYRVLVELAQELARQRLTDGSVWGRVLQKAESDANNMGSAELVSLLDALRRVVWLPLNIDTALAALTKSVAARGEGFTNQELVKALASLSRLGNHVRLGELKTVLQLLLNCWLSRHDDHLSSAQAQHVISLLVSLTNISEVLGVETKRFVDAVASWAQNATMASFRAEELVLFLWSLKELSPLGYVSHKEVVAKFLQAIVKGWKQTSFSLSRLVNALDIVIAAEHAMGSADEVLLRLVASELATTIDKNCPIETLTRILALCDRTTMKIWERFPLLAASVCSRALALIKNPLHSRSELQSMLDTVVVSSFSRTPAFVVQRAEFSEALHARGLAELAASFEERINEEEEMPRESGGAKPKTHSAELFIHTPIELIQLLGEVCQKNAINETIAEIADMVLLKIDELLPGQEVLALETLLQNAQERFLRMVVLVDIVERLGDLIADRVQQVKTAQLVTSLTWFAAVGLPHYLVFETALGAICKRCEAGTVGWDQAVRVLESFATVRLRIFPILQLHNHIQHPHTLARFPTMALIRFLTASARLGLFRNPEIVREIVDRALAETSLQTPLPLESTVMIFQGALLSGTVLDDRQLRHCFTWLLNTETKELTRTQLFILGQYALFLLMHPNNLVQNSILRLPVEAQRFVIGVLRHDSSASKSRISNTTRVFREEVVDLFTKNSDESVKTNLEIRPAGAIDVCVGDQGWFLDGPEAFFRPFTNKLVYTPHANQREWLLRRCLTDLDARRWITDFAGIPTWPKVAELHRLNWFEWVQTPQETRKVLLKLSNES